MWLCQVCIIGKPGVFFSLQKVICSKWKKMFPVSQSKSVFKREILHQVVLKRWSFLLRGGGEGRREGDRLAISCIFSKVMIICLFYKRPKDIGLGFLMSSPLLMAAVYSYKWRFPTEWQEDNSHAFLSKESLVSSSVLLIHQNKAQIGKSNAVKNYKALNLTYTFFLATFC